MFLYVLISSKFNFGATINTSWGGAMYFHQKAQNIGLPFFFFFKLVGSLGFVRFFLYF